MEKGPGRVYKTIRMKEGVYYQARVASVVSRKSVGQWLEEAILEKLWSENGKQDHQYITQDPV